MLGVFCELPHGLPDTEEPTSLLSLRSLVLTLPTPVTFLLIALGPAAQAQNSGGGWVAQPAPATVTASAPEYDWDGYHVTDTLLYKGAPAPNIYISPDQFSAGHTFASNGKEIIKAKGNSVFKWLWTPTDSNVGAPAPPLYVLGEASVFGDEGVFQPLPGFLSSITFHYSSTVDGLNDGLPFFGAQQYKIEPTEGNTLATATLKPTMTATFACPPGSPAGFGNASSSVSAFPIVLANPNPMNRPDLGDGTNQYVYDATAPQGLLNFPGAIQAVGSAAADTAWIMRDPQAVLPHVGLTLDLPAETTSAGWFYLDTSLNSAVPADQIAVKYGTVVTPSDGFLFQGLPKLNSDLGNHSVTLTVDTKLSQKAHIQTFFTGIDAKGNYVANYPNAASNLGPDNSVIPNWYYYNQVYTSPGTYDHLGQTPEQLAANIPAASHIDLSSPYAVHIHDDAYNRYNLPVFDIDPKGNHYIRFIGSLAVSGIQTYIWVCAHEKGHQDLSNQTDSNGKPVCNWLDDPQGAVTADGDDLSDTWEALHHMNPNSPDTTRAYGTAADGKLPSGDIADDEVTADVPALGSLITNLITWQNDWADAGLQWGGGKALAFYPKPTGTQEGFYLVFTPVITGAKGKAPYQIGTTYHVHNLAELKGQYPSLLTSLP